MKLLLFGLLANIGCITTLASTPDTTPLTTDDYVRIAREHEARNEIEHALALYKRAHELNPTDFTLTFEIANLLLDHEHTHEAIEYYERAINLNPTIEQVYFNKGVAYNQLNQHEHAAHCFMQAIDTNCDYEHAYVHAIKALRLCNKLEQGIAIAKRSVKAIRNNAELHYRYGLLLKDKESYPSALKQFKKAVTLEPTNRHYLLELGNTLLLVDAQEEALYIYEHLLATQATDPHLLYNFGTALDALGFTDRALQVYTHIIELCPTFALAHFGRSRLYLAEGNYSEGFATYEWRWKLGMIQKKYTHITPWTGAEDLKDKTLLIYAEQGLGDTLQFIRYAELAKQQGAHVIVEAQRPLRAILASCPFIDELLTPAYTLPHIDYQIALMSMPHACKTTLETIPLNLPYIQADPTLVAYWQEKLANDHNLKIGICWQGNKLYTLPELRNLVAHKSIDVALFAPLAALEGVSLYSLQYNPSAADRQKLEAGLSVISFDKDMDTEHGRFMDTCAIMKNLDLIISVDTAICHLAGALDVPVWTLLPHCADWRWLQHRTDSPWYPSMRLFRQDDTHAWQPVIKACCDALQPILQGVHSIAYVTQEKGQQRVSMPTLKLQKSSYLQTNSDHAQIEYELKK